VALTDGSGFAARRYDYDAFGVEREPDPLDGNSFRYCGEYWDKGYYSAVHMINQKIIWSKQRK
jgi:hypothetical protein